MNPETNERPTDDPAAPQAHQGGPMFTPVQGQQAPAPFLAPRKERLTTTEVIRRSVLGITLGVLAIAVLVFLSAINSVIEVWLQYQWVPIARAVVAVGVIALCVLVLFRLTGLRK